MLISSTRSILWATNMKLKIITFCVWNKHWDVRRWFEGEACFASHCDWKKFWKTSKLESRHFHRMKTGRRALNGRDKRRKIVCFRWNRKQRWRTNGHALTQKHKYTEATFVVMDYKLEELRRIKIIKWW